MHGTDWLCCIPPHQLRYATAMNTAAPQNKKPKQLYTTTNWHDYDAALTARGSLLVWLDKDMQWLAEHTGNNGRPAKYTDAAIQFCLSIKCLFNLPLRQCNDPALLAQVRLLIHMFLPVSASAVPDAGAGDYRN